MSHISRIRTQMIEREFLLSALNDLGHAPVEGRLQVRGYGGSGVGVEIKMSTHDIGFRKAGGSYEMIGDWWGIRDITRDDFLRRLSQRYAYYAVRRKLEEQGFALVSEETQSDGQARLVLRRAV